MEIHESQRESFSEHLSLEIHEYCSAASVQELFHSFLSRAAVKRCHSLEKLKKETVIVIVVVPTVIVLAIIISVMIITWPFCSPTTGHALGHQF